MRTRIVAAATANALALMAGRGAVAPAAARASEQPAQSASWHRLTPPLTTPWTSQVGPHNALPEYPRPQLTRRRWQNLNGVWEFAAGRRKERPPIGRPLGRRILVPYPVQSALSGIMRSPSRMWYRRTFTVPAGWAGEHVLLHFGAVDDVATVWVNGVEVAHHAGGYDAFTADITRALTGRGEQEIVVGVRDPSDAGSQPIGKQRRRPGGIFYTASSGIWQTVWLEPVPRTHIGSLVLTPDVAAGVLRLTVRAVHGADAGGDVKVIATAFAGRTEVGRVSGSAGATLRLRLPDARLWSPGDPFLYHLRVELVRGGSTVDTVGSYFGMRSVGIAEGADGTPRLMLNGKPIFALATLDQGYWPDGIYTAPTDEALRFDLEQQKRLGFNAVRKHVKVEPARWYYWADRLGLLVWQDMPAMKIRHPSRAAQRQFVTELHRMIEQHRSDTAVIGWVPFNEGWGEFAPARVAADVKRWDPSRLVDADSGVNCCYSLPDGGEGDVYDDHTYVGPGAPPAQDRRIAVDGEYGGLGLVVAGHDWPGEPHVYEMEPDSDALTARYEQLQQQLLQLELTGGISAAVYTQATDVENEVNGLYTYDRRVCKVDAARIRAANLAVENAAAAAFDARADPP